MLTEIYIEALLVDEELADQVWEAWDAGEIGSKNAAYAWLVIAGGESIYLCRSLLRQLGHTQSKSFPV